MKQEKREEDRKLHILQVLSFVLTIITIVVFGILFLVIFISNIKIQKLEKELEQQEKSYPEILEERIPLKESIRNYMDSLPLPEMEVMEPELMQLESTSEVSIEENIEVEEQKEEDFSIVVENDGYELAQRVEGMNPTIVTFSTTAYCSCELCCDKTDGITASGERTTPWYTLSAGSAYPLGTIIYIPALSDKPNGGWFIVQDRGGAISDDRLDIYLSTHEEALQYGRRTLECYVYTF